MGSGSYATDLDASWSSASVWRASAGIGYRWVAAGRFSVGIGLGIPVPFGEGGVENATFRVSDSSVVLAPADIASGIGALDHETFYAPVWGRLSFGYILPSMR